MEDSMGQNPQDLALGEEFLDTTTKARFIKEKY